MNKEITTKDIQNKYTKEESKILKDNILSCIETINKLLQDKYQEVVEKNQIVVSFKDLNLNVSLTNNSKVKNIVSHLNKFYTTWDMQITWSLGECYILIKPLEDFDKNISLDSSMIREIKKEITFDDTVKNRSEILDL